MHEKPLAVQSQRYSNALARLAGLHRRHSRKGKPVPHLTHLIAFSAMVREDVGMSVEQTLPATPTKLAL
jgi:hypothetical protein